MNYPSWSAIFHCRSKKRPRITDTPIPAVRAEELAENRPQTRRAMNIPNVSRKHTIVETPEQGFGDVFDYPLKHSLFTKGALTPLRDADDGVAKPFYNHVNIDTVEKYMGSPPFDDVGFELDAALRSKSLYNCGNVLAKALCRYTGPPHENL